MGPPGGETQEQMTDLLNSNSHQSENVCDNEISDVLSNIITTVANDNGEIDMENAVLLVVDGNEEQLLNDSVLVVNEDGLEQPQTDDTFVVTIDNPNDLTSLDTDAAVVMETDTQMVVETEADLQGDSTDKVTILTASSVDIPSRVDSNECWTLLSQCDSQETGMIDNESVERSQQNNTEIQNIVNREVETSEQLKISIDSPVSGNVMEPSRRSSTESPRNIWDVLDTDKTSPPAMPQTKPVAKIDCDTFEEKPYSPDDLSKDVTSEMNAKESLSELGQNVVTSDNDGYNSVLSSEKNDLGFVDIATTSNQPASDIQKPVVCTPSKENPECESVDFEKIDTEIEPSSGIIDSTKSNSSTSCLSTNASTVKIKGIFDLMEEPLNPCERESKCLDTINSENVNVGSLWPSNKTKVGFDRSKTPTLKQENVENCTEMVCPIDDEEMGQTLLDSGCTEGLTSSESKSATGQTLLESGSTPNICPEIKTQEPNTLQSTEAEMLNDGTVNTLQAKDTTDEAEHLTKKTSDADNTSHEMKTQPVIHSESENVKIHDDVNSTSHILTELHETTEEMVEDFTSLPNSENLHMTTDADVTKDSDSTSHILTELHETTEEMVEDFTSLPNSENLHMTTDADVTKDSSETESSDEIEHLNNMADLTSLMDPVSETNVDVSQLLSLVLDNSSTNVQVSLNDLLRTPVKVKKKEVREFARDLPSVKKWVDAEKYKTVVSIFQGYKTLRIH